MKVGIKKTPVINYKDQTHYKKMSWLAITENSGQTSHQFQRIENKCFHAALWIFRVFYNFVRGACK